MTLGSHQHSVGRSQNHITPKWFIDRLGPFDLDPCAAEPRPWECARINWTSGGLDRVWFGLVYLNPPFDRYEVGAWIAKLARHGNGITLLHARTEAGWFEPIWQQAAAILFMFDRIKFCRPDGTEQPANSGAPPILAAFGVASTFKYARAVGTLEAVIVCCGISMSVIEPSAWKKFHHLPGKDKEAARQRALQLFPCAHALLARKKDHQRAEAMLLALMPVPGMILTTQVAEITA